MSRRRSREHRFGRVARGHCRTRLSPPFSQRTSRRTRGSALSNTVVGGFTDADPQGQSSDFTAVINWGDGASSAGAISQTDDIGAAFNVIASHTYATAGNYNTQINVADAGGSTTTLSGTANVTDLPVTGSTRSVTAVAGQNAGQFVLATFEDPEHPGNRLSTSMRSSPSAAGATVRPTRRACSLSSSRPASIRPTETRSSRSWAAMPMPMKRRRACRTRSASSSRHSAARRPR